MQEVDDLEGRFGLVVGLADLGGHWLQGDRSEDVTQEQCRLAGLAFEQVLQTSNALGHPFDGWSLEDLAGGGFEGGELIPEGRGPLLGQLEGLTERRGPGVTAMLLKLLREECPTQLGSFNRCRSGSVQAQSR